MAIVLGLWALLIAATMSFSVLAPTSEELQARKLQSTPPATLEAKDDCDCITTAQCWLSGSTKG